MIYLDTSAIVPYYVPEKLSAVVEQLLQKQENKPIISQLVEVELFSALSRRVRMGEVSQNDARRIINFQYEFYLFRDAITRSDLAIALPTINFLLT